MQDAAAQAPFCERAVGVVKAGGDGGAGEFVRARVDADGAGGAGGVGEDLGEDLEAELGGEGHEGWGRGVLLLFSLRGGVGGGEGEGVVG